MKWDNFLNEEFQKEYFKNLNKFLDEEYATKQIFPKRKDLFLAFKTCEYEGVKVVILGQDPYYKKGQAHGLSFSVNKDIKIPKSLINIYKELENDLNIPMAKHGNLLKWANQGVFLLNTVLSVEEDKPYSHSNKGWEIFTDNTINILNKHTSPLVFILWGSHAKSKEKMIDSRHLILSGPHPSPLSAYRGFFNSKPFSKTNEFLIKNKIKPIDWKVD